MVLACRKSFAVFAHEREASAIFAALLANIYQGYEEANTKARAEPFESSYTAIESGLALGRNRQPTPS